MAVRPDGKRPDACEPERTHLEQNLTWYDRINSYPERLKGRSHELCHLSLFAGSAGFESLLMIERARGLGLSIRKFAQSPESDQQGKIVMRNPPVEESSSQRCDIAHAGIG